MRILLATLALSGLIGSVALVACGSDAPPAETAPTADASSSGCGCTEMACASGADVRINSPVPLASLASTQIEVCRLPSDCQSTPLLAGTMLSVEGPSTVVFHWNGTNIDRSGDRYAVSVWKDGTLLFRADAAAATYEGKRVNTCSKSVNGRTVPCDPPGFDCYRASIEVTLASTTDGGVDAGIDADASPDADASADAPLDAVDDG